MLCILREEDETIINLTVKITYFMKTFELSNTFVHVKLLLSSGRYDCLCLGLI